MKNLLEECIDNQMYDEAKELLKLNNESITSEISILPYIANWKKENNDFVSPANDDWVNGFIAGFEMARKSK